MRELRKTWFQGGTWKGDAVQGWTSPQSPHNLILAVPPLDRFVMSQRSLRLLRAVDGTFKLSPRLELLTASGFRSLKDLAGKVQAAPFYFQFSILFKLEENHLMIYINNPTQIKNFNYYKLKKRYMICDNCHYFDNDIIMIQLHVMVIWKNYYSNTRTLFQHKIHYRLTWHFFILKACYVIYL